MTRHATIRDRALVCGGAGAIVGSLFLPWYWRSEGLVDVDQVPTSGWAGENGLDVVVVALAVAVVAVIWFVPAQQASWRGALVATLGAIVSGIVITRTVDPPKTPGRVFYVGPGLLVALFGAALVVAGGLLAARALAAPLRDLR